jgi:hypothetical protein
MAQTSRRRGRPAKGNDPAALTVLQAKLLLDAKGAGVPVSKEAAASTGRALATLSGCDLSDLPVVAGSPVVLEAMARLLETDPDAFLKHYETFLEFHKPKLGRVEHKVEGLLGHQVFVPVERREEGPPPPLESKIVSEQ